MNDRGANVDVLQRVTDALQQRFAGVTLSEFRQDTRVPRPARVSL